MHFVGFIDLRFLFIIRKVPKDRKGPGTVTDEPRPDCYQRLEFFIQVLRVLCPNLTDASLVVCSHYPGSFITSLTV